MADVVMGQNDILPLLVVNLNQGPTGATAPIPLSGATVTATMTGPNGAVFTDRACSVTNSTTGEVTYTWQVGDTANTGLYNLQFRVSYGGGAFVHVPNEYFLVVNIVASLA